MMQNEKNETTNPYRSTSPDYNGKAIKKNGRNTSNSLSKSRKRSANNRNGSGTISWIMNDYRPYRVVLNYDIHFKRKGGKNCANPNHTEKAKELFGEEMRKHRKAKNNNKKKKNV